MAVLAKDLRDALLQAAIQGKLTKQLIDDGNADSVLKEIENEKSILETHGKKKNKTSFKKVTNEEAPFDIPENWCWCSLNDVSIKIHYGFNASSRKNGNVKLLRITDIQNNQVNWDQVPYCNIKDDQVDNYKLKNRDIVVARTGGTIGKTYIVRNLKHIAVFASYLIRIIPSLHINEEYLKYFMESDLYWRQLIEKSQGTGQPNVNGESLKSLILPLPPFAEQERIVVRVEELMTQIDEYEKIENQLVELQKKFPGEMKEALLQAAIQGKLTQSNEDDSYANELLVEIDRCKNDYVSARKIKGKELLPITQEDEENFELKPKWCLTRLGNLCTIIFMGKSPVYEKQKNGYLCIGQKNNQDNGFTTNGIKYVTKAFWESVPEYQHLRKNDVLLNTLGGGTVGRSGMYTIDDDAITDGHVMVIRFKDDATAKYVLTYLQLFRSFIEDSANGSTNQKFINLYDVKNYLIPLPPLSEQKRIVEKLEKLMNICDALNS